jgi:hypothetical protein
VFLIAFLSLFSVVDFLVFIGYDAPYSPGEGKSFFGRGL